MQPLNMQGRDQSYLISALAEKEKANAVQMVYAEINNESAMISSLEWDSCMKGA